MSQAQSFRISDNILSKVKEVMAPHVKKHAINDFLSVLSDKYSQEFLSDVIVKKMQQELFNFIIITYFNDENRDLISLISFNFFVNQKTQSIDIKINNTFTLYLMYNSELPPYPWIKNNGSGKEEFEWKGYKYIIENNGQCKVLKIEVQ